VLAAAIRVFLLDDHRVFAESLALVLGTDPSMRCVAVAHTVEDGLRLAERLDFDVALVDLQLPDGGGLAAIPELLARRPGAAVVVLTAHARADLARRAFAAGAVGFLGKDASLTEITDAVRAAPAGRRVAGRELPPDPADRLKVTPREHEVLIALSRGLDATRIAGALGISLHTTRDHIRSVMGKLGVRTQLDAVVTAERLGLVDISGTF
jgi:DNA-binding NarL/FixJ family response regulator